MTTLQRLFRGPLVWILLALFALYLVFQLTGNATYKEVPTSEAVAVINGNDKLKEVILTAGEQTIARPRSRRSGSVARSTSSRHGSTSG